MKVCESIMEINRGRFIPGMALILFGTFLMLEQLKLIPGETFLIFLGVAFLGVYYLTGKIGFIIPGCILTGFGTGVLLLEMDIYGPDYMFVFGGLAAGFYLITVLAGRKVGIWPLIPGTVLILFAFFIYGLDTGFIQENAQTYFGLFIPAVLILVGISIIVRSFFRKK